MERITIPTSRVDQSKALAAIDRAERAIAFFTAAPDDERSDLLALMLASGRELTLLTRPG